MAVVHLTFDDGPVAGVTDAVLDLLAARGHRATFFCVGANLERQPELARRALAEGHRLANHTLTHPDGWRTPTAAYLTEVAETDARLTALGARGRRFRPPYGRLTPAQWWALRHSHRLTWWHSLAWDWDARLSPEQCLRRVLRGLGPGRTTVLHDSARAAPRMLPLLPALLNELDRRGWRSVPLDD